MSSYKNIGDELPDAVPAEAKKKSPYNQPIHIDHGFSSFITFLMAVFLGSFGYRQNLEAIAKFIDSTSRELNDIFQGKVATDAMSTIETDSMMSGQLMMLGAVILLICSLSFAGASLAKEQSSILGLFVIVLSLSPVVYSFFALIMEWPSIPSLLLQL